MNIKKLIVGVAAGAIMFGAMAVPAFAAGGFDQYGYNYTARIFNGNGYQWCAGKYGWTTAQCDAYLGVYAPDKIIMKWNAEWDRGNAENWASPPYNAWTDNEWNGKKDGSGQIWHYKIVWVGDYGTDPNLIPDGAYGIWGQFAVIMDQGTDPNIGPGHEWFAHASPAGYGAYYSH